MLVPGTVGALIGFAAAGLAAIFNLHPAWVPVFGAAGLWVLFVVRYLPQKDWIGAAVFSVLMALILLVTWMIVADPFGPTGLRGPE
jgi:uncharacterized membrane protein